MKIKVEFEFSRVLILRVGQWATEGIRSLAKPLKNFNKIDRPLGRVSPLSH